MTWQPMSEEAYNDLMQWGEGRWYKLSPGKCLKRVITRYYKDRYPVVSFFLSMGIPGFLLRNQFVDNGMMDEIFLINFRGVVKDEGKQPFNASRYILRTQGSTPLREKIHAYYKKHRDA